MPTVSVIVPGYNHAPYLRQRIDSILNQTYKDFELILLDDCSSDNSQEIMKEYAENPHVTHILFNERNSGSTFKQWERGLSVASGKYIWIAESDDYASPSFLEETVNVLSGNPGVTLVFTGSYNVDAENRILKADPDKFGRHAPYMTVYSTRTYLQIMLWKNCVYNASGVVFRKSCYEAVTDKSYMKFRYCGDWLFWIEIGRQGEVASLNRKLNYFRQHNIRVSPKAEREGLYFSEGGIVKLYIMYMLGLSSLQRMVITGKVWKQLMKRARKYPTLIHTIPPTLPRLYHHQYLSILIYELDKFLHFSGLKRKK